MSRPRIGWGLDVQSIARDGENRTRRTRDGEVNLKNREGLLVPKRGWDSCIAARPVTCFRPWSARRLPLYAIRGSRYHRQFESGSSSFSHLPE
jgi:hypothetical protein